ncbi:SDR family oxidoreductase [Endozoicomonas ascidiicola]|uniref:SDR family oxidoreductase n=1 Tax=Endozoicomonas ascidiicola TaxID=1698521 RepID=UPI00082990D3|nr:SDR family oxidoreductase [Endozoicomonas ascidiicola]
MSATSRILITGAAGYLGHQVGNALSKEHYVIGCDIRHHADADFAISLMDICDGSLSDFMKEHQITHIIHLASIVDHSDDRDRDYKVDVEGTRNVIEACIQSGVQHLTVTSSGAAYGYHEDNDPWLSESSPIRGNYEFAYSWHKRLVEEMLAEYRISHPSLQQLILRPGTILGKHTRNLITNLFMKKRILSVKGSDSPFVFIWDEDVVAIICRGVSHHKTGAYNLAGDGAMAINEIASQLKKPLLSLSPALLKTALALGQKLKLTKYGPDQLKFLRYRPVLDNKALKEQFGYTPQKTSAEVFDLFCSHLNKEATT